MQILNIILPLILVVSFGFVLAKAGYINDASHQFLSKFAFNILVPILLFQGALKAHIPEQMPWLFLFSYYFSLLIVFLLSWAIAKFGFHLSDQEQGCFGMTCSYSNATIVGLPVCLYALGEEALLPLMIIVSIHNIVLFTLGFFVAERQQMTTGSILRRCVLIIRLIFTSPITMSLLVGGLFNVLMLSLPKPVDQALAMISEAAIPLSLMVLGSALQRFKMRGYLNQAIVVVGIKLFLFPMLVWIFAYQIFQIPYLWSATALLTSAMPTGISAYVFSQKYQIGEASVASSIFLSTVCSVLSLTGVLLFI